MWLFPVLVVILLFAFWKWRTSKLCWQDFFILGFSRCYASIWLRCQKNNSPLPAEGPALVVLNHSCSADPMFLLGDSLRILSFITTRQHMNLNLLVRGLLAYLGCVGVERGGHDPAGARQALRRLAEGRILCIFPEGNLSGVARKRMRQWKHGAAYLALKSGVAVFPAYIEGGPRTDNLLLAWIWRSGKATRVHYGTAVELSSYRGKKITRALLEEVTGLLKQQVLKLNDIKTI